MALAIAQKTYNTGSFQNFLGNEVEEYFEITGDGVGGTATLTPKRMRTIDAVDFGKEVDVAGFNYTVTNTAGAPSVAITIPAGLTNGKILKVRLRGQFQ